MLSLLIEPWNARRVLFLGPILALELVVSGPDGVYVKIYYALNTYRDSLLSSTGLLLLAAWYQSPTPSSTKAYADVGRYRTTAQFQTYM